MTPSGQEAWRRLPEERAGAARQMAIDEAVLDTVSRGEAPVTFRVYRFTPPALSLGRHQPARRAARPEWLAANGVDLVRRPTGGGAVLHEADSVTYAIVLRLPFGDAPACGVAAVSRAVAGALRDALAELGAPVELQTRGERTRVDAAACFARPSRHEILVGGRKLVGSAQLRRGRAVLQHGTVPLSPVAGRHRAATGWDGPLPAVGLREALGREVTPEEVAAALESAFRRLAPAGVVDGVLGANEAVVVEVLRARRYLDATWTLEGRARGRRVS